MGTSSHYTSANLGGVKRGDSEETGDLEAQPTETADRAGSGGVGKKPAEEGVVTGDPSALGVSRGPMYLHPDGNDLDDLTVMDASDPALGLTNIGDIPADDWAADTGPTHSAEEEAPSHKR